MGKKNRKKPDRVIDLYNRGNGVYIIYCLGPGGYSANGAPKSAKKILPFIDSRNLKGSLPSRENVF